MGLAETARSLQAVSKELQWLRDLRTYTAAHDADGLREEICKLEAESEQGAAAETIYLRTLDVLEQWHLADFYSRVLCYAEMKERREKGGAEKAIRRHWLELMEMERRIAKRYDEQRTLFLKSSGRDASDEQERDGAVD